jgi:hypothetical protein
MHSSALFRDRDGVIHVDHGYVHRPGQFEFVPGIFPLPRFWADEPTAADRFVVSNQSGIGRPGRRTAQRDPVPLARAHPSPARSFAGPRMWKHGLARRDQIMRNDCR